MGDYRLSRTRTVASIRSSSAERPAALLVTRTRSVPDLTSYIRASSKYKPQWPYRYYRDWDLYDDYWYDRYYYFSPLYKSTLYPRRYYYSDYLPNPYYWNTIGNNYWIRYKGYWYDYDNPTYYRRSYDPYYGMYQRSIYTPYRSYLLDSMSNSFSNALSMYRQGTIPYSALDRYWLTPSYWDRRFKDWRDLYSWEKERYYTPSYYNRRLRSYYSSWS